MSDETKPTAYLHTLDNTEGIEENTPLLLLRFSPENPFGKPGINYSEEYPWTVDPLYTSDEITRLRADLAAVKEERDRMREAGNSVVEWWLKEGMKHFNGAPSAMFALRKALGHK